MMQVTINKVIINITSFGKSMYGGWYANFTYVSEPYTGTYDGIRRRTLTELCNQLHISKTALKRDVPRLDN